MKSADPFENLENSLKIPSIERNKEKKDSIKGFYKVSIMNDFKEHERQ